MKIQHSILSSKGQITIPAYVRNKLQLSSGIRLEFIIQSNSVLIVPISKSIRNLKGILPKPEVTLSIEEMNEFIKNSHDRN